MNYTAELKKFATSQYIYSGIRIALAIVVPSIILAYFGLLKEYFLFPLGTSFVGLTDQVGPFVRRRNALILAILCFVSVATIASILQFFPLLIYLEIIVFGIVFSMIGVYGQRLAAVGGITLVIFSIFIDGQFVGNHLFKSLAIFTLGCIWFFVVFLIVTKLQPYKLSSQLIGENYIELADYLRIKARFYQKNNNQQQLYNELIARQVVIKNLQEETREVVFKTRTMVNESTTASRLLMLMFLNSIDFYEKLMTSDQDYQQLQNDFENDSILEKIHDYLLLLSEEISNIGIALQIGSRAKPLSNLNEELQSVFEDYFQLRNQSMSAENVERFMSLRMVLSRIKETTNSVKGIYQVFSQDIKLSKSLSANLDLNAFVPKQEEFSFKIYLNNFSLKSLHFRYAIRITLAMLLGYAIAQFQFLGIGHAYWILITIVAIMRPAYSTTKHRNLLRLYGTASGAILAYFMLTFIHNDTALLAILFASMILCFAFLKGKYSWAVFFMTIYIFITFNFLNPGNVDAIFKDRIIDTLIAGVIIFLVSYFVLPVWEHTHNLNFMKASADANRTYFLSVIENFEKQESDVFQYKLKRKNAIISLANMSDNFQRMLSDPKNQRDQLELVHQFVTTSHLVTAYTASLSQYAGNQFPEIDIENWRLKISNEFNKIQSILYSENKKVETIEEVNEPQDLVNDLLLQRKSELEENDFYDHRDISKTPHLAQLKNIKDLLALLFDVVSEQRKIIEKYRGKDEVIVGV